MEKKLEFTDSAKNQIEKITKSEEKKYFRIAVQGGGCSGFKYNFSFDDKIEKDDILFNKAVIDKQSLDIIAGSTVDFKKEIESQGDSYEKLREDVKKEMIIARVQRGIVGPKVFISEQELNNFINSVEGQNLLVIEYKFDQILLKDKNLAEEVLDLLNQGQNFDILNCDTQRNLNEVGREQAKAAAH